MCNFHLGCRLSFQLHNPSIFSNSEMLFGNIDRCSTYLRTICRASFPSDGNVTFLVVIRLIFVFIILSIIHHCCDSFIIHFFVHILSAFTHLNVSCSSATCTLLFVSQIIRFHLPQGWFGCNIIFDNCWPFFFNQDFCNARNRIPMSFII